MSFFGRGPLGVSGVYAHVLFHRDASPVTIVSPIGFVWCFGFGVSDIGFRSLFDIMQVLWMFLLLAWYGVGFLFS